MNILIAGGTGFVGKYLSTFLKEKGHHITLLTRKSKSQSSSYDVVITWDNLENTKNNFDVIINLCGYGISEKKWSASIKQKLINSRTIPTEKLVNYIGASNTKLINSSAIGFYGFSNQRQTEDNYVNTQNSFSHEIVQNWEKVVIESQLKNYQIIRFGVVLGNGGMVAKLLPSAKFGLGAKIGSGKQLISWIHINDLCRIIELCVNDKVSDKIINATTPSPVSQVQFITAMSTILKRPKLLWLPAKMVKLMFGQMGEELLLSSQNIYPGKLVKNGYNFKYPDVESALKQIICNK